MKKELILVGKVMRGNARGKKLGFPTANIQLHKNISEGIYLSVIKIEQKKYPAVTFIGAAKTFNETERKAETYILLFDKNLYGYWISVRLIKKIRNNKKFKNVQALVLQMEKDKAYAVEYFKNNTYV